MAYIDAHTRDYEKAGLHALDTNPAMLYYDAIMCLTEDPLLKDGYFEGVNAAILIGAESTEHWQKEMAKEALRFDLPVHRASSGDIFCAYASPADVLRVLRDDVAADLKLSERVGAQ